MRALFLFSWVAALLGCIDLAEVAAPPAAEQPPAFERSRLDGFDVEIRQALGRYQVPGAVVAAVYEDHLVFSQGFGKSTARGGQDEEGGQTLSEDSLFRIGTLTRTLASSLLATLVDDQRLDWQAELPDGPDVIAFSEALAGRGEIAWSPASGVGATPSPIPDESLGGLLARATLAGESVTLEGGMDAYAALIYRCLEASGVRARDGEGHGDRASIFRQALQERLVGPAGMVRTAVADQLPALVEDFASPHIRNLAGSIEAIDYPSPSGVPSSGVASTAADLGRFLSVHLQEGIAQSGKRVASGTNLASSRLPILATEMPQGSAPMAERCCGTGAGWRTAELGAGLQWLGAEGGIDGYAALIGLLPERGVGLVVLANLDAIHGGRAFAREVRDGFLARLLERAGTVSHRLDHERFLSSLERLGEDLRPAPIAQLAPYFGDYQAGWSLGRRQGVAMLHRGLQEIRLRFSADQYVLIDDAYLGARVFLERDEGRKKLRLRRLDGTEKTLFKLEEERG